jgi:hypothetical protein
VEGALAGMRLTFGAAAGLMVIAIVLTGAARPAPASAEGAPCALGPEPAGTAAA